MDYLFLTHYVKLVFIRFYCWSVRSNWFRQSWRLLFCDFWQFLCFCKVVIARNNFFNSLILNNDFRWLICFFFSILVTEPFTYFRINYLIVLRASWLRRELIRGLIITNLTSTFQILCHSLLFYQLLNNGDIATFLFWRCWTFIIVFCYRQTLTLIFWD